MKRYQRILAVVMAAAIVSGTALPIPVAAANTESQTKQVTDFANVVLFANFKGDGKNNYFNEKAKENDTDLAGRQIREYYDGDYGRSMKNYLNKVSDGQFAVHNVFPQMDEQGNVDAFELPYDKAAASSSNIDYNIITAMLEQAQIDVNGEEIDYNNDGVVDNLTIILVGGETNTTISGLPSLYPHQSSYPGDKKLGDKLVRSYNLLNTDRLIDKVTSDESAVIVHEFLHSLGYPDLYRQTNSDDPVYLWDIMGYSSKYINWPLAYMRQHFTGWTKLPEKTQSGKVQIEKANDAVILKGPANPYEFFVVESRVKTDRMDKNTLDSGIGGTGVIVYRVDTTVSGLSNNFGKTGIYVFRPQKGQEGYVGKEKTDVANAFLPYGSRTSIGLSEQSATLEQGALTYSDGSNSGIVVSEIQLEDPDTGRVSFQVTIPDASEFDLWEDTSFPSADRVHAVSTNETQYAVGISGAGNVLQTYEYNGESWEKKGEPLEAGAEIGAEKLLANGEKLVYVSVLNADHDTDGMKEALRIFEWDPNTMSWTQNGTYTLAGEHNEFNGMDAAVMGGEVYIHCVSSGYGTVSLMKYDGQFHVVSSYIKGGGMYGNPVIEGNDDGMYLAVRSLFEGKKILLHRYTQSGTIEELESPGSGDVYALKLYNGTLYNAFGSDKSLTVKKYDSVSGKWSDYAQKEVDSFTIEMAVAQGNLYAITRPSSASSDGKLSVYAIQESSDGASVEIEMEGSPVGIPGPTGKYGLIASNENLFAYYIHSSEKAAVSKKATVNRLLSLRIQPPSQVTYMVGDRVSEDGLQVTANYVKHTRELSREEFVLRGFDTGTVGERQAVISFGGVENTFTYQVFDRMTGNEVLKKGDVNNDGEVNLLDLRLVLRYICNKGTLKENQINAANVAGNDDVVNLLDLRVILRYICRKGTLPE